MIRLRRLRALLVVAAALGVASCDLNPQPSLPDSGVVGNKGGHGGSPPGLGLGGGSGAASSGMSTGGQSLPEPAVGGALSGTDGGAPGEGGAVGVGQGGEGGEGGEGGGA